MGKRSTGLYGIAQRSTVLLDQTFCPLLNWRGRGGAEPSFAALHSDQRVVLSQMVSPALNR